MASAARDVARRRGVSVVALVLRFRRAGAVQHQQIKWFADGAAPSIPLGMFAQARPLGPYHELLGAVQLAGVGIGIFRFRLWDIDRLINRILVYGLLTVLRGAVDGVAVAAPVAGRPGPFWHLSVRACGPRVPLAASVAGT